ncbi:hypothetical protein AX762_05515 [Alkalibacterium sp. 20]|nr:hypothetical protein AX762_05515 [Alkalibacterium sp. 20]
MWKKFFRFLNFFSVLGYKRLGLKAGSRAFIAIEQPVMMKPCVNFVEAFRAFGFRKRKKSLSMQLKEFREIHLMK